MKMHVRPFFAVKKHNDGQYWICIEQGPTKSPLTYGTYGFELEPGVSLDRAEALAKYMGEKLEYFVKL